MLKSYRDILIFQIKNKESEKCFLTNKKFFPVVVEVNIDENVGISNDNFFTTKNPR